MRHIKLKLKIPKIRKKNKLFQLSIPFKLITRLDWYIIKKFLGTYIFSIILIISIAVVFDFNENMDKMMDHNAPWKAIIFDYYMNFIPYFANLFSQLFVFISVIFFTTKLAEHSEIIAMFSSGVSFKRILRPYMMSAGIIALATYYMGAYVIPRSSTKRLEFTEKYIRRQQTNFASNVQLEVGKGVIAYIENYQREEKTGMNFSLDKFKGKKLVSHLTASSISYDSTYTKKNRWTIHNYMIRKLVGMREKITRGDKKDTIINMQPNDILIVKGQEQELKTPELKRYIIRQKERGFANIQSFEIEYYRRYAIPFAAFILTLIGASLSSRKTKGGMGLSLGIGLALSFSYILFQSLSSSFAINGNFPPMIAVWIPNIIYAFIAFFVYKEGPK
ncbi:MAG: YjgP/YjgQ family permease [Bacteroidales bacterium]|nr:YjgP/YjgQ family permease [Bacteroidales bacterium]